MNKKRIHEIGIKAYSLEVLKHYNLFPNNLLILRDMQDKKCFKKKIVENKFDLKNGIFIRMSSPVTSIKLPKGRFYDVDSAYKFIKEVKRNNWTVIIHDQLKSKYGGTITNIEGNLVMEFIEGEWNADYTISPDELIFNKDGSVDKRIYSVVRKTAVFKNGKPTKISIKPLSKTELEKIIAVMKCNIKNLFTITEESGFNSVEFYISPEYKFIPFELQNIDIDSLDNKLCNKLPLSFFEISSDSDLLVWDGKGTVLLTIPCDLDRADKLIEIASKLKGRLKRLYVKYGLLSHPAIILREMGFEVKQIIEGYSLE